MPSNPTFAGWRRGTGDETHSSTGDVLEILVPGELTATHSRQVHITQAGDHNTDWALAAQANPLLVVHSTTTPITTYMSFAHNATDGVITSSGATNSGLTLTTTGTGQITLQMGGTDTLNIHDAAAVAFAGATDVAGHALYMQTEDGGVACAGTAGAGGLWNIQTGDGGIGAVTGNRAGGAGGALDLVSGTGGATASSGSGAAANGGAMTLTGGVGGAVTGTSTGAPGVGAVVTIVAGTGGATAVACDTAGAGGELILQAGPGGAGTASSSCTGGAGGTLTLRTGTVGCGASNGAIGRLRFLDGAGTALFSAAAGSEPSALLGTVWAYQGGACAVAPAGSAFLVIVDDGSV